ncbi:hypothetical protein GX645_05185 [Candidatus Sumerlaeota bacterium]|nr:hypothetical protein [Candidatus Sumerlaeota bacterium]
MNDSWHIPLFDLNYDDAEARAVQSVLDSKWLTMGPKVAAFEAAFQDRILQEKMHCLAVTNCTCALELAVRLAVEKWRSNADHDGLQPVVLVPDLTFAATANAVISAGATVDFVDAESPVCPLMSASDLSEKMSLYGARVAAVIPVHYAGFDALTSIADVIKDCNVSIIEDAAHAVGGCYDNTTEPFGSRGDYSCFSFFSNKNLSTGEGGLIACKSEEDWSRAKLMRSHGMTSTTYDRHTGRMGEYDVVLHGHNYRFSEIAAALGLAQLDKLREGNDKRRQAYALYVKTLHHQKGIHVCFADCANEGQIAATASAHILPMICADTEQRLRIAAILAEKRIQTSHHYRPLSSMSAWSDKPVSKNPNAAAFAARELTLPLYPTMTSQNVMEVCETILKAL